MKKSAKGLLRVEKVDDGYALFDEQTHEQEQAGELKLVFEDSKLILDDSLDAIRARLA